MSQTTSSKAQTTMYNYPAESTTTVDTMDMLKGAKTSSKSFTSRVSSLKNKMVSHTSTADKLRSWEARATVSAMK